MLRYLNTRRTIVLAVFAIIILFLLRGYRGGDTNNELLFTVSRNATPAEIQERLWAQDFTQDRYFFRTALFLHGGYDSISAGGYMIPGGIGSWALADMLTEDPLMHWVTIPEGLRKEQVADRLAEALGWDETTRDSFLTVDVAAPYNLSDGFYFPDTYLIPTDEAVDKVAKRFINRFNDNFAPYVESMRDANIKYDTAIKLASIIQREAGGKSDMALIAGILWNRLLIKMPLQVDATLQYARGDEGNGYWAPITVADKKIDSPFNTYANPGLPPSPISNPGLDAIDAVLNSEETDCLYYIHDNDRQIHCGVTYEEHLANIEKYLKN